MPIFPAVNNFVNGNIFAVFSKRYPLPAFDNFVKKGGTRSR